MILSALTGLWLAGCTANPAGLTGNPYDPYGYGTDTSSGYTDTSGDYSSGDVYDDGSYSGSTDYGLTSPSPSPSPSPTPIVSSLDDRPVLSAIITEVKETGLLGMGTIIAKVEIENPANITLSGKLRVLFTDNGDPTANAVTRRVTLRPKEKQVLTFTAKAWRLDDAEASIETDEPKQTGSSVVL